MDRIGDFIMVGDFTLVDIFASKGVDYLFAIISLLLLIRLWKYLSGAVSVKKK